MNDTVLLMNVDNKFEPSDFWIPEKMIHRILTFVFFILIWFLFIFVFNTTVKFNKKIITIGFISGLVLLIIYDYLFNYSISIAVDQQLSKFFLYNPVSQNVVLNKKILNFKINAFSKKTKKTLCFCTDGCGFISSWSYQYSFKSQKIWDSYCWLND